MYTINLWKMVGSEVFSFQIGGRREGLGNIVHTVEIFPLGKDYVVKRNGLLLSFIVGW